MMNKNNNKKKINFLIMSYSNPYKVAGIGCLDLKNSLKSLGHNVKAVIGEYGDYPDVDLINYNKKVYFYHHLILKIKNKIYKKINKRRIFNIDYSVQTNNQTIELLNINKLSKKLDYKPDAIILFFTANLVNFIDIYNLYKHYEHIPIFFILPDMADFTGLCHYAWDCKGYQNICGKCPAINSSCENDQSRHNIKSKIYYSEKTNIIILCWSNWLIKKIKMSTVFRDKCIEEIPYIAQKTAFFPLSINDKNVLRKKYKIDQEFFVISISALSLSAKRKGILDIIEAINLIPDDTLRDRKVLILISGGGKLPCSFKIKEVINLGILDWDSLVEFYQLSDLFVSASKQEVGPATIVEALLCGVPVISYNTGFAAQYINNGFNGYLIDENNIQQMSDSIMKLLNLSVVEYRNLQQQTIESILDFNSPEKYNILEKKLIKYIVKNK